MTPHLAELLDGLMLGGAWLRHNKKSARLLISTRKHTGSWLQHAQGLLHNVGIEASVKGTRLLSVRHATLRALHARWYPRAVPFDVKLTAGALALWWSGAGTSVARGHVLRFAARSFDRASVEQLARSLGGHYGWRPEVADDRGPVLKLVQYGDRRAFEALVAPLLMPDVRARLLVAPTKPCSLGEAARRRAPRVLTAEVAAAVRQRLDDGERQADVARDVGVSQQQVSRIGRGLQWTDVSGT